MNIIRKLLRNSAGAAAMEYAFILGVIAVGSVVGVGGLGTSVKGSYEDTSTKVHQAVNK